MKSDVVFKVASIAPTNVDVRRFVTFEQTNSINGLSDDERFLIQVLASKLG